MATEFGEKLQTAVNSIETLIWRDKTGKDVKLVDASGEELSAWYKHAKQMLYNKSIYNPGKKL